MCLFAQIRAVMGFSSKDTNEIDKSAQSRELINDILNVTDYDGMRPLDLLAFRIDDDQKNFIKEFHGEEKNYKIPKQFELYTWGRSSDYNLGYP